MAGRLLPIATAVALIAAGLFLLVAPTGPAASGQLKLDRKGCGTYKSESIYNRAKVIALQGVSCRKARKVAKRFDHTGDLEIGRWRCGYAHADLPNLFSCGWPAEGDLRESDHALLARGVPGTQ